MTSKGGASREHGIDLLRALSVALVVCSHYGILPTWFPIGGYHGVVLFFAISGYCMALTVPGRTLPVFLMARYKRLLPAFIACALLTFAVEAAFPAVLPERGQGWRDLAMTLGCLPTLDIPCEILYRQALDHGIYFEYAFVDGAYWSLLVEFRFYALFAMLYFGLRLFLPTAIRWVWMPVLLVALAALHQPQIGQGRLKDFFQYLPFFAFGLGVFSWRRADRMGLAAMACSVLMILVLWLAQIETMSAPFGTNDVLIYLGMMALMAIAAGPNFNIPAPVLGPIAYLAAISFPLYLIHQDIGRIIIEGASGWAGRPLAQTFALAVALLLASSVHYWIEIRAQSFKYRRRAVFPTG